MSTPTAPGLLAFPQLANEDKENDGSTLSGGFGDAPPGWDEKGKASRAVISSGVRAAPLTAFADVVDSSNA